MDGVHDCGGMHGFGPVKPEHNEPVFHHEWEKKVFGMMIATMGQALYNVDEFRHAIELMDPVEYLSSSYYEHWLASMEKTLADKGIVTRQELEARVKAVRAKRTKSASSREDPKLAARLLGLIRTGGPTTCPTSAKPRFNVGDRVVTRNDHPHGHTRLPRYACGRNGTIDRVHGSFICPDSHAHGLGRNPQYVYGVRFSGRELWGQSKKPNEMLHLDLWESYLEPA